jgi:hypothetical protein
MHGTVLEHDCGCEERLAGLVPVSFCYNKKRRLSAPSSSEEEEPTLGQRSMPEKEAWLLHGRPGREVQTASSNARLAGRRLLPR